MLMKDSMQVDAQFRAINDQLKAVNERLDSMK